MDGRRLERAVYRERLALFNTNPMTSVSIRVNVARAIGGWDASVSRAADWNSPEPTVLHFRAAERDQDWRTRVRQNAAWFARLQDPASLLAMRICLRRVGAAHNAGVEAHAEELERTLEATRHDLLAVHQQVAAARAEAKQLAAEAKQLATMIARIYDGGWWRLRRRVLPLMRLLGRGG